MGGAARDTCSAPSSPRPARRSRRPIRDGRPSTGSRFWMPWTRGWRMRPPGSTRSWTNLSTHRATDVLLWSLPHPRWEFVFQPTYAAYLNLIEPWWKVLRSLALKGRRFATWDDVCTAVKRATAYWNAHRHPFVWGTSEAPDGCAAGGNRAFAGSRIDLPDGPFSCHSEHGRRPCGGSRFYACILASSSIPVIPSDRGGGSCLPSSLHAIPNVGKAYRAHPTNSCGRISRHDT